MVQRWFQLSQGRQDAAEVIVGVGMTRCAPDRFLEICHSRGEVSSLLQDRTTPVQSMGVFRGLPQNSATKVFGLCQAARPLTLGRPRQGLCDR
jgi:hypothetical protein